MYGQAVIGTFDAYRLYRHGGEFAQDEADAGHGVVNLSIRAAGTFGEDDDTATVLDGTQHLDDAGGVGARLVYGNSVAVRQRLLEAGGIKERFAGQEEYLVAVERAYQGRVKEALVIGYNDAGAFFDEFFPPDNLQVEKGVEEATGSPADDEVE